MQIVPNPKLERQYQNFMLTPGNSYTQTRYGTIIVVGGAAFSNDNQKAGGKCVKLVDFERDGRFKPYFMQSTKV